MKICILTAGVGSRLQPYTDHFNKVLLPYQSKSILDHALDKLPKLPIVLVVGHKKEQLVEYAKMVYGEDRIEVVEVDDLTKGPGYSLRQAREKLQCPFYLVCGDCIFDGEIPSLDKDFLGITKNIVDKKSYCTLHVENGIVKYLLNKTPYGYDYAFIGFAGINQYQTFWQFLSTNAGQYPTWEFISAWRFPGDYSKPIYGVEFDWVDQGTTEQFILHQTDKYAKNPSFINEITYIKECEYGDKEVIKITDSKEKNLRRIKHGHILANKKIIPPIRYAGNYHISSKYIEGNNLYESPNLNFDKVLSFLELNFINSTNPWVVINKTEMDKFYREKTLERIYLLDLEPQKTLLKIMIYNADFWEKGRFARIWHGDLNFSNVIQYKPDEFITIDWRDCFTPNLIGSGDLYYDLAKFYAGLVYPLADVNLQVDLSDFKRRFEKWCNNKDLDIIRIRRLAGLVFANIAPLYLNQSLKDKFTDLAIEYIRD